MSAPDGAFLVTGATGGGGKAARTLPARGEWAVTPDLERLLGRRRGR
jgi:hypothetical protein